MCSFHDDFVAYKIDERLLTRERSIVLGTISATEEDSVECKRSEAFLPSFLKVSGIVKEVANH